MPTAPPLAALVRSLTPDAATVPDAELLGRYARDRDQAAFELLVWRHGGLVWAACRRVLAPDRHAAEDACQAAFAALAAHAGRVRDGRSVAAWLHRVAVRAALDLRAAGRRATPLPADRLDRPGPGPDPARAAGERETWSLLDAGLDRLPDRLRVPFVLCELGGHSHAEAAAVLGCAVGTVGSRLTRARHRLRRWLAARGVAPAAVTAAAVPDAVRAAMARAGLPGEHIGPTVRSLADRAVGSSIGATVRAAAALSAVLAVTALGLGLAIPGEPTPADPPTGSPAAVQAARVPADPTGDPLPPGAIARMGSTRFRFSGLVHSLAFALDGRALVVGGVPSAEVWDARTGRVLHTFGHRRGDDPPGTDVVAVGLCADGRTLIVAATKPEVGNRHLPRGFVWDLEKGVEVRAFSEGHHESRTGTYVGPEVFAPDGSMMAEADCEGASVWVWDRAGTPLNELKHAVGDRKARGAWRKTPMAFGPDGKTLFTALPDHTIKVWDCGTGRVVRAFGTGRPAPRALAASADGTLLATFAEAVPAGETGRGPAPEAVRLWNPATGTLVREFPWGAAGTGESYSAHYLGFTRAGTVWAVAAAESGLSFREWNPAAAEPLRAWTAGLADHSPPYTVALSPDGTRLAVGTRSGVVLLLDATTGRDVTPGRGHRAEVREMRFTPSGSRLVTVSDDRTARVWDVETGAELRVLGGLGHFGRLSADAGLLFDTRQDRIGEGPVRWTLSARDVSNGRVSWESTEYLAALPQPDPKIVWVSNPGLKGISAVDPTTGKTIRTVAAAGSPFSIDAAGRLAVGLSGREFAGWDLGTGERLFAWDVKDAGLVRVQTVQDQESADGVKHAALSPDGKFLCVVVSRAFRTAVEETETESLYLCEADTGKVVWRVKSDTDFGRSIAFRPDGRRVAVAGWKARVFDAATGEERAVLDGHRGFAAVVAFSRDGKRLATGGSDGTAVVWDVSGK
jgi:RNA polymerase sigma factor (sigma-70 family)